MVLYTVAAEIAGQPVKNLLIKPSKGSEWMKHLIRERLSLSIFQIKDKMHGSERP